MYHEHSNSGRTAGLPAIGWLLAAALLALPALPLRAGSVEVEVFPVPTPASRPYTITAGPDGCLYFTESNGNKVARITPEGVITEFPVPTPRSGPYGIATGADGGIWFTERFADQIGRLDPVTGHIDEYPVLTAFAQPWEIAAGPDGNLWFTEEDVAQIGRITPQGQVTEFGAGTCCFPTGITAGADGNLWFTVEIGDQIVRMTPRGQATVFQIQTKVQLLPWDITPGPDGNVWFTELAGRSIGRVTPLGGIDRFPVDGDFSGIAGIGVGPEGWMWFTENDTSRIGAMKTTGAIKSQADVSRDSRPLSIVLGPDGNVWFTMADGNGIGRIHRTKRGVQYVLSMDAGFSPPVREARLGERVQWTFIGPRPHGVRDASGLGLFDSGPLPIVSFFQHEMFAAATYACEDPMNPEIQGTVRVPVQLPRRGEVGTAFHVTWSTREAPKNLVFDVEVKLPGDAEYQPWLTGTTGAGADYTADGPGSLRFRSRVRHAQTGQATGMSPGARIRISG